MRTIKKLLSPFICATVLVAPITSISSCNKTKENPKSTTFIVEPSAEEKTKAPIFGVTSAEYNFTLLSEIPQDSLSVSITKSSPENLIDFTIQKVEGKILTCEASWKTAPEEATKVTFDVTFKNSKTNVEQTIKDLSLAFAPIPTVTGVSIKSLPNKTKYNYREELNLDGLTLNVQTDAGTFEIPYDSKTMSSEPEEGSQVLTADSKMIVKITVGDFTDEFLISVNPIVIGARAYTQSSYAKGETIFKTDIVVVAQYSNGDEAFVREWDSEPAIPDDGYTFEKEGINNFDITHEGYQKPITSLGIVVSDPYVNYITVSCKKPTINIGQTLYRSDMEVIATFCDGHQEAVTGWTSNVDFPHTFTKDEIGEFTIDITYANITESVNINVVYEKIVDFSVEVTSLFDDEGDVIYPSHFIAKGRTESETEYHTLKYGDGPNEFKLIEPQYTLPHTVVYQDITKYDNKPFKFRCDGVERQSNSVRFSFNLESISARLKGAQEYRESEWLILDNIEFLATYVNHSKTEHATTVVPYNENIFSIDPTLPYIFTEDDVTAGNKTFVIKNKLHTSLPAYNFVVNTKSQTINNLVVHFDRSKFAQGDKITTDNVSIQGVDSESGWKKLINYDSTGANGYKFYVVKDGTPQEIPNFDTNGYTFTDSGTTTFEAVVENSISGGTKISQKKSVDVLPATTCTIHFHPGDESLSKTAWTYDLTVGKALKDIPEQKRTPAYDETLYEFLGWSRTLGGDIVPLDENIFGSSLDLYAVYKTKGFDINYCLKADVKEETTIQLTTSQQGGELPDLWYSIDKGINWTKVTSGPFKIATNGEVYFKGYNPGGFSTPQITNTLKFTGGVVYLSGNVMSLATNGAVVTKEEGATYIVPKCFASLFEGSTGLRHLDKNLLYTDVLEDNMYQSTFANCTNLVDCPDIPNDDSLAGHKYCFNETFKNCRSLMAMPSNFVAEGLKAQNYPEGCYASCFENCVSIADPFKICENGFTATLGTNALSRMFANCNNVQMSKENKAGYKKFASFANVDANGVRDMFTFQNKNVTPSANSEWYYFTNTKDESLLSLAVSDVYSYVRTRWSSESTDSIKFNTFAKGLNGQWSDSSGWLQNENHLEINAKNKNDDYRHAYLNFKLSCYLQPHTTKTITLNFKFKNWSNCNISFMFTSTKNAVTAELFDFGKNGYKTMNDIATSYYLGSRDCKPYQWMSEYSVYRTGYLVSKSGGQHSSDGSYNLTITFANDTDSVECISEFFALSECVDGNFNDLDGNKQGSINTWFTIQ